MIWFISDLHFNHRSIIWRGNRPFKNVEEMDEQLIKNWNRVVKKNDEIWYLGDFGWQLSPTRLKEIMEQLNGHKHLILGNHDKEKMMKHSNLWESVDYYKKLSIDGYMVILFHFPIADFEGMYNQSVHLFGHIHGNNSLMDKLDKNRYYFYNVSADVNNLTPISWNDIKLKLGLKQEKNPPQLIY